MGDTLIVIVMGLVNQVRDAQRQHTGKEWMRFRGIRDIPRPWLELRLFHKINTELQVNTIN